MLKASPSWHACALVLVVGCGQNSVEYDDVNDGAGNVGTARGPKAPTSSAAKSADSGSADSGKADSGTASDPNVTDGTGTSRASNVEGGLWAGHGLTWPKDSDGVTRIHVCFITPGFEYDKAVFRSVMQAALAAGSQPTTWSQVARIEFTGWGECRQPGTIESFFCWVIARDCPVAPEVRIRIVDEQPIAAVGRAWAQDNIRRLGWNMSLPPVGSVNPRPGYWGPPESYVTHEFGHTLGFEHEQDRLGAPRCNAIDGQPAALDKNLDDEKRAKGIFLNEAYDPDSVMNYCNHAYFSEPRLSMGDVIGVRQAYGVRGQ